MITARTNSFRIPRIVRRTAALAVGALSVTMFSATSAQAQQLGDLTDSASYAVGVNFAKSQILPTLQQLAGQGVEIDPAVMAAAISDVLMSRQPVLSDSVAQATLVTYQQSIAGKVEAVSEQVMAEGVAYLAENGKKSGVTTTASGLQYEVLAPGQGMSPDANDKVSVRYRGTRTDGLLFDENWSESGVSFPLNGVIRGWTEGLQLMKVGARYRFVIPANLAYGAKSPGGTIRPNETLVFEVELLTVEPVE